MRAVVASLPMPVVLAIAGGLLAAITLLLAAIPLALGLNRDSLWALGYQGIFIANLLGTASLIPLPVSMGGQAMLPALAGKLDPVWVAVVGGTAMSLGELSPYIVGRSFRTLTAEREVVAGGLLGSWLKSLAHRTSRLVVRHGIVTLFVLSMLPNPLFEVAGITAGASEMRLTRFFPPVVAGKFVRAFALVFVGTQFLHLVS